MPQQNQHYSYADIDAYAFRVLKTDRGEHDYQVISISSDNTIKVLTLNQSFVN